MDELQEQQLALLIAAYDCAFDVRPNTPYLHATWIETRWRPLAAGLATVLQPVVEPLAESIARQFRRSDLEDFAASAVWDLIAPRPVAPLPRICAWDPALGRFEVWARATLIRMAVDCLRQLERHSHDPLYGNDQPVPGDVIERRIRETRLMDLYDTPFTPNDLQRMECWGADYRLELTLIVGLWVKFPQTPGLWEVVQRAYEAERGVILPTPFPPGTFLTADELSERITEIAPALGYPGFQGRNSLRKRWDRNHTLLQTLDCMRDFRPDAAEP